MRYADDLVVMCRTRREAEQDLAALRAILVELGLEPKQTKTRIVHLREGGEGLDFLGFHHRWVRARGPQARHISEARWPSRQAMQHARDRVRQSTTRQRLLLPVEEVTREINTFLRGWWGYFRYGNSARHFDAVTAYAFNRLALFVGKRHQRGRGYGRGLVQGADRVGLISLDGCIIAPRPNRAWRGPPECRR